ncbi:MAG TPA: Calx-beta domain-containing protein, partial [Phycisphaerae bacterium]|nr:Calx-beta domain-containing protein [Phycisphaerae bacterium]
MLLLLGSQPALAAAPPGDWWDTGYAWRKKITLTDSGSGTPAGTVLSFTFDHAALVSANQSQADGDDIRIACWDGANWTELSRVLASASSWNLSSTQILFKAPRALAASGSSDDYYLYYGNPSAAAPAVSVPTSRWYKTQQLAEQSTTSTTFVNIPNTGLTFTPGDASETWLVFVSGVIRSSNTTAASVSVEMCLLINGVEVDLWGHQNNGAGTPNGAGFLIPEVITGTAATQTIQPQFRAGVGTSYASLIRVVVALVPPNADLHLSETDAIQQLTGSNLSVQSLTFTPSSAGDYLILGKVSHHENPSSSTVQSWVLDDAGNMHPDAPSGTHFSDGRVPWAPFTTVFRRTLPASSRSLTLKGTSSGSGAGASEWRYARLTAFRMDAWEAPEYSESLTQSTTTSTSFQTKTTLTTAAPPAARDYLVIQAQRMSGNSTLTTARKAGELRDGGSSIMRTDHRINCTGSATTGYHHVAGVANAKQASASVTYDNGYLSPNSITVECADSTITSLRYRDVSSSMAASEPVPTVTFSAASQSASESAGSMTVTAQLSAVSAHDVTVPFTVGGTASTPSDYTITASPITITAGSTTATITISIVNDLIDEPDETVIVTMGTPTGADQGTTAVHTATILDDDVAGVIVTETGGSTNLTEGGATDTYTIVLNSQPTADVTITVAPDGRSSVGAGAGVARQLTFTAANWDTARSVTVTATDDPDIEGAHTSTITHTSASTDPYYSGVTIATVTAHITDNDTAGVIISESGGSTNVTEGGATDTYTVVLNSRPVSDVTVTTTPDAQSSVGAGSGVARQLTFSYDDWNSPQTITVTATDDPDIEGPHTSMITHTTVSADPNYNGIGVAGVTAHITDNDSAGVVILESGGSTNVTEGGATDTYT